MGVAHHKGCGQAVAGPGRVGFKEPNAGHVHVGRAFDHHGNGGVVRGPAMDLDIIFPVGRHRRPIDRHTKTGGRASFPDAVARNQQRPVGGCDVGG